MEYLARHAGKEDPQQYRNRHSSILFAGAPVVLIFLTHPYRSSVDELLQESGYSEAEIDCLRKTEAKVHRRYSRIHIKSLTPISALEKFGTILTLWVYEAIQQSDGSGARRVEMRSQALCGESGHGKRYRY